MFHSYDVRGPAVISTGDQRVYVHFWNPMGILCFVYNPEAAEDCPGSAFRIPRGFCMLAQGCGTPLPWVPDKNPFYPKGVTSGGLRTGNRGNRYHRALR